MPPRCCHYCWWRYLIIIPVIFASGTGCSGQALPRSRARLCAPPDEEGQRERRRCHAFGNFMAWDLLAEALPSGAGRGEADGIWLLGAAILRHDSLLLAMLACVGCKNPLCDVVLPLFAHVSSDHSTYSTWLEREGRLRADGKACRVVTDDLSPRQETQTGNSFVGCYWVHFRRCLSLVATKRKRNVTRAISQSSGEKIPGAASSEKRGKTVSSYRNAWPLLSFFMASDRWGYVFAVSAPVQDPEQKNWLCHPLRLLMAVWY